MQKITQFNVNQKNIINIFIVERNLEFKKFNFDKIFPENSSQSEIFEITSKNIIDKVISGYNGTIIAYGQSSTGKSYTLSNDLSEPNLQGIIPRAFDYLFNKINEIKNESKNTQEIKIEINIAFIQIYLETIQDLLCPKNIVKIREDSYKGIYLDNITWINVINEKECKEAFQRGGINRITEKTKINENSSRSHAIFIINVERHYISENIMTKGSLYLVDLAGSERVGKSYLKGKQLEQAIKNNHSLAALGNCVNSIINNESYIPFRDSKLTRVLQNSLEGNSNISLIITLSPSNLNVEETLSSLNFGSRAMEIKINPKKNYININSSENYLGDLNQKYVELFEKYDELDKKYKDEENEKEIMNKEYIEAKKLDEEKQTKIINQYEEIIKEMRLKLENKDEIIKNLNNELNKIKKSYVISLSKNKELDKKLIISNSINKKNQNILTEETKKLLNEQGFNIEQINNQKINQIIRELINNKKQNDSLKHQINILNDSYEQLKKNYEEKYNILELEKKNALKEYPSYIEKIEFLEKENIKLKNINNINLEKMNDIEEEKNTLKKSFTKLRRVETEKNKLANEIVSLREKNSQLISKNNDIANKYQEEVRKYEDSKIPKLSNHYNYMDNIRFTSSINFNEKLLSNNINIMNNDLELFNKFRKESKGIDTIIENDIPSLSENNYDIVIKKAKNQISKIENLLDNVDNISLNDKNKFKNNTFIENITKLNEIIKLYKENFINVYILLKKTFNKLIYLCQKNNAKEEDKSNEIKEKSPKEEKKLKNKILELTIITINKFKPFCFNSNNSDIKEEINKIQNNSEKFTLFELMKNVTDILQKIILRSAEYRTNKEKEIKNLKGKIAYYMKEVDNYKRYYDNNKKSELDEEKRLLNNQLFLQDGEINRLNKENENLIKTIQDLMNKDEDIMIKTDGD